MQSHCGSCDPGTVVYAPFPGVGSMVQATAVSQVIEGYFIVQWTGSPNLCITPTDRSKCVVDATKTYNGRVTFKHFESVRRLSRVNTVRPH